MKPGDIVKISRYTFLHKGVFVLQNSEVEILQIDGDSVTVLYRDKEGLEHHVPLKITDISQ